MASSPPTRNLAFSDLLLAWWDEHGRKDLPWQHPRTPYRVWVSEVMLQQTQVTTVIPYFERWMERLPDLRSLAAADEDDVLALWSGLGYYARARNLHRAARLCVERFRGNVPDSFEDLRALPGIGPSTANAIISQTSDIPAAVVDGNVKRLLARHAAVEGWPGDSTVLRKLWSEAVRRLPRERGADYTQAVMDLGATVCTRTKPGCRACPVSEDCQAFKLGSVERYPAGRPKKPIPDKTIHMMVIQDREGRVLLKKRPPNGIWGGLWSLPEGESREEILAELGIGASGISRKRLPDREHRLTHLKMLIRSEMVRFDELPPSSLTVREGSEHRWFDDNGWRRAGLPKPVRDILGGQEFPGS